MYVNSEFPCYASSSISPYVSLTAVFGGPVIGCDYLGEIVMYFDGEDPCVSSRIIIDRPVSLPFTASNFYFFCPDSGAGISSITFS
jgi:hypothetical protein